MKNIHVLPTNKPSKLLKQNKGKLIISKEIVHLHISRHLGNINQNIYITSDEEIKEGDWCYDRVPNPEDENDIRDFIYQNKKENKNTSTERKIILTTDQDLIADGVQAIDDDFLEWFVKNPSCEELKIGIEIWNDGTFSYRIIIPKEEPNVKELNRLDDIEIEEMSNDWETISKQIEPKQETLEEVIEKLFRHYPESSGYKKAALIGKEWQQERSYSEQEVFNLLMDFWMEKKQGYKTNPQCVANWFEQFKKK